MSVKSLAAGGALLASLLLLTACSSTPSSVADDNYRGLPTGVEDPLTFEPFAVWLDEGERFVVVTYGSSTCPHIATELSATPPSDLEIDFWWKTEGPCTMDLGPWSHEFTLPDDIAPPVSISLTFQDGAAPLTLTLE